ncbi:MAG: hypothetical protein RIA72_04985 [Sphingopyxis sp.]|uniref:hypothetical protein n=1 Tax=Sphingopyxis sp. TaxID=1908224 RepID=UPI0032EAF397
MNAVRMTRKRKEQRMLFCMVGMGGEPSAVRRMALLAMLGAVMLAPDHAMAALSANCPAPGAGQAPPSPGAGVATRRASSGVIGAPNPTPPPTTAAQDGFGKKLDRLRLTYTVDKDGDYRIVFNVRDTKRTQLLYISGRTQSYDCLVIREFFAPAAKVSASVDGAKALELMAHSHTRKIGSWEIHSSLLMFTAKIPDVIDGEDLRSLINLVVNTTDEAELKLTGADVY